MIRSLLVPLIALALVPVAVADGPRVSPGVIDGGAGALAAGGDVRYATVETGARTVLEAVATNGGKVVNWRVLRGGWGIPAVAYDGSTGGISQDGSTLVLAHSGSGSCTPTGCNLLRTTSRFKVFKPKTLQQRAAIALKGDFAFDALSPNGRTLYLIQHTSAKNLNRYRVRAYDLKTRSLAPGAVADRAQRGWAMQGMPMARTTSSDGRFAYTLYQNPGGFPFVHALDTVRASAHCIGLRWPSNRQVLASVKLTAGGRTLSVGLSGGRSLFAVDTRTYRVSQLGT
jgi:hypothetical protein